MTVNKEKVYRNRWFYTLELIFDIFIVVFSYYFGFRLQRQSLFKDAIPNDLIIALVYIGIIAAIVFVSFRIYKCGQRSFSTTLFYLAMALPIIAVSSIAVDFAIKGVGIWRKTIFYAVILQIPAFLIFKLIVIKIHDLVVKRVPCTLVGATLEDTYKLYARMQNSEHHLYDIKYLVSESCDKLYEFIDKSTQVILCASCEEKAKYKLIEYCSINNIDCSAVPEYHDIVINSGRFNNVNDLMLLDMDIKMDIESRFIKRTMDIIISSIAIIILSPLMVAAALLIKLQDGGNPIFSQKRVTRYNKEFSVYKFRTMIMNAEKNTGAVLATVDDNRITKLGKFLRSYRIDEIPQFFNVLKGDMSIVGPRPERKELIEQIIKETPTFEYRTLVKAGITGLAQTMGRYDTEFRDKLLFDMYYVNNYSLSLDIKILFSTVHTLTKPSVTSGVDKDLASRQKNEIFNINGYTFKKAEDHIIIEKSSSL